MLYPVSEHPLLCTFLLFPLTATHLPRINSQGIISIKLGPKHPVELHQSIERVHLIIFIPCQITPYGLTQAKL